MYMELKDVLAFADKKNPKECLNYVRVDADALCLVATNTKAMVKVTFESEEDFNEFLNSLPFKSGTKEASYSVITHEKTRTHISDRYPDCNRVLVPFERLSEPRFTHIPSGLFTREFFSFGCVVDFYGKDLKKPLEFLYTNSVDAYISEQELPAHFYGTGQFAISKSLSVPVTLQAAVMQICFKKDNR